MSTKIDTFMPFFIADYLADTTDLSTEEHGAYFLLLINLWKRGGRLPFDHGRLARMVGMTGPAWARAWVMLERFFDVDAEGQISQGRQLRELERAQTMSRRKSDAGRQGAVNRWQPHASAIGSAIPPANATAVAEAMQSQCLGDGETMPSHISHLTSEQITDPRENPSGSSGEAKDSPSPDCDEDDAPLSLLPKEPAVLTLPCLGGARFGVTGSLIEKYAALYPALDVLHEFKKLADWLDVNTDRRSKGGKGTLQRISRWMNTAHEGAARGPRFGGARASPVRDVTRGYAAAEVKDRPTGDVEL